MKYYNIIIDKDFNYIFRTSDEENYEFYDDEHNLWSNVLHGDLWLEGYKHFEIPEEEVFLEIL